jgi:hypothetical protein
VRFTFIQPVSFAAEWKRLGLTDLDLQALETALMENPEVGDVLRGTGGMRKMRFAPPSWNRGKSGATRVCYIAFAKIAKCYLTMIFQKNEKANLTPAEAVAWRKWISRRRKESEDEKQNP